MAFSDRILVVSERLICSRFFMLRAHIEAFAVLDLVGCFEDIGERGGSGQEVPRPGSPAARSSERRLLHMADAEFPHSCRHTDTHCICGDERIRAGTSGRP